MAKQDNDPVAGDDRFLTTRWSMVLAARERASPDSREALAKLCQTYWYPLFTYVRRQGFEFSAAQDVTQDFFAALLEKDFLKNVGREKGLFRSFLLVAIKHFIANQRRSAKAKKRGGGKALISIDYEQAEQRYQNEPAHKISPEHLFEQQWALTLLQNVLNDLEAEYSQANKADLFGQLKVYLGGQENISYGDMAHRVNLSEGAVKVAVHRLRQRFGQILRAKIADTVSGPDEIDAEIAALFQAIRLEK